VKEYEEKSPIPVVPESVEEEVDEDC